ncbi:MAG TPA: PAS domain-containing protein, partial [bacterium]|nr:PAS domain-containing protein [bacterium]
MPESDLISAVKREQEGILIVGLAALFFAMVLAWFLSRRFSDPIAQLTRAADQMASGDLHVQLPTAGSREIQSLSHSFDRMRSELQKQMNALREKSTELEIFFSSALDLLCIADTQGNLIRVNKEWEKTFGFSVEQLEGMKFLDLVHPDDLQETLEAVAKLERQEQVLNFTNRYRCRDGSYRLIEWRSSPRGSLIYAAARDITERRRAEEELQLSRERLDLGMDASNSGLWDWNVADNTVYFDPRYFTMAGYQPDEFPHAFAEWEKRVHPDDIDYCRSEIDAYLSGRSAAFYAEFRFLRNDGSWMWIRGHGKAVERGENGAVRRMVGTHADITERKQAEFERQKLQEQLAQAQKMESVGRLAGGVAHDFNNMLTVINGHTAMALEKAAGSHAIYQDLLEIRRAAQRSADLTRQLLGFARRQVIAPSNLDLNKTVEGMLSMLRRLIGEDIHLDWRPG